MIIFLSIFFGAVLILSFVMEDTPAGQKLTEKLYSKFMED